MIPFTFYSFSLGKNRVLLNNYFYTIFLPYGLQPYIISGLNESASGIITLFPN